MLSRRSSCVVLVTELSRSGQIANAEVIRLMASCVLIVKASVRTSLSVCGVIMILLMITCESCS